MKKPQKKSLAKQVSTKQWFKFGAYGACTFIIMVLCIYATAPKMPKLQEPPLKTLAAAHGVDLGVLTYPYQIGTEPFSQVATSQYNMLTIDGVLHWDQMRPSKTMYDFAKADKIVDYAADHNMKVQVHHLVWTEDDSLPKWLKEGNYNKDELYGLMHEHISTVMGHYKGKVQQYTVVNEPFSRAEHLYGLDNWWGEKTGGGYEYIDKAFLWARAADPNAELILNDFFNETETDVADRQYEYMKSAKERGIPIDGIGMQFHIDTAHPPDREAMRRNMERFGALGYKIYVTEFDMHASKLAATSDEQLAREARITTDVVRACVESKSCASFTVFGMREKQWFQKVNKSGRGVRFVLLNSRYQPKPSYDAFYAAWQAP